MPASRRRILAAGAGALLARAPRGADGRRGGLFASAATNASGGCFAVVFDFAGEPRLRLPLPSRAHQVAVAPDGRTGWVLPRRPGRHAWRMDLGTLSPGAGASRPAEFASVEAAPGRHFYGHALFSPDGERVFVTENDYPRGRGVVSARCARTFETLAEFDSGGVGPHQLAWLTRGRILAVANGGIRTHPSRPREKLNLRRMRSNLAFIDAASGRLLGAVRGVARMASIRHVANCADGRVIACAQFEGRPGGDAPLVLLCGRDHCQPFDVPNPAVWRDMRGYTASVAVDEATSHALVTCPRANHVAFFDTRAGRYVGRARIGDCGGVAVDAGVGEFVVTTGLGRIARFDARTFALRRHTIRRRPDLKWDNHLTPV